MKAKKARLVIELILLILLVALMCGCVATGLNQAVTGDGAAAGNTESNPLTDAPFNGVLGNRSDTVDVILLMTALSILPSGIIMITAFTRIIIVLSFIRNAMGTQQMPPNQVMVGLALFLAMFVMQPVIKDIQVNAYQPYIEEKISLDDALAKAATPLKSFMLRQTYTEDLSLFVNMGAAEIQEDPQNYDMFVIIPAFMTSEIKHAFLMGFFIYIPFLVIDMVVASTLMAMGMMMLPPVVISLPFKVLLFVIVDGWLMTVQTLITSFG